MPPATLRPPRTAPRFAPRAVSPALVLLSLAVSAAASNRIETQHLIVEWVAGTPEEAIATATRRGEEIHASLRRMLGHEPDARLTILLEGPGLPDGSRGYPRVDARRRIHLLHFGPTWHSYFDSIVHEMVHAFRGRRGSDTDWFFEEAFAELVALRLDPDLSGFPWFGHPVTLAAGQWIVRGEDIPLKALRERHRSLNLPCMAQSYTLRSDFLRYLARQHGPEAVLGMAAEDGAGRLTHYETHFGADLWTLEKRWRGDLLDRYDRLENADSRARAYREGTPIAGMKICTDAVWLP